MIRAISLIGVCALLMPTLSSAYEPNLGLSLRASTLGLGMEMTTGINSKFNLRAGINQFDYDVDPEVESDSGEEELTYSGTLDLSSLSAFADWHPWGGAFRLSAGAIFNGNEITASATCEANSCEVGGESFTDDQIGTINALIDFDSVAPYLGLGWGNAVAANTGFGFQFDVGVMFQGTPAVSLSSEGSCSGDPSCQQELDRELEEEERELQEDSEEFDVYPVISLGIRYKFF